MDEDPPHTPLMGGGTNGLSAALGGGTHPQLDPHRGRSTVAETPQKPRHSASRSPQPSAAGHNAAGPPLAEVPVISRLHAEHSHTQAVGAGSFGEVWRAVFDEDGMTYAVKVSSKLIVGEGDLQHRLQEAYAAAVCSNQHLLRYYDCWLDDGKLHLRTEFVEGGSIQSMPKPWGELDVAVLLQQIAVALHWLHGSGIAHLDVKPENILMVRSAVLGRPVFKLGDFGLARRVVLPDDPEEHFRGENDDEGDHRYLCPVILKSCGGTQAWNKEADIYSLGASIVELTGGNPGLARFQQFGPHLDDPNAYPSPELAQLVRSMCSEDPSQRPTALEVVEAAVCIQSRHSSTQVHDLEERLGPRRRMLAELQRKVRRLEEALELAENGGSA